MNKEYSGFLDSFSESLIIYDPLNRPVPSPEDDQTTKKDDFIELIKKMKTIPAKNLKAPFTQQIYQKFLKMIDQEF